MNRSLTVAVAALLFVFTFVGTASATCWRCAYVFGNGNDCSTSNGTWVSCSRMGNNCKLEGANCGGGGSDMDPYHPEPITRLPGRFASTAACTDAIRLGRSSSGLEDGSATTVPSAESSAQPR